VNSKEENSEDFCVIYVHEFGLKTLAVRENRLKREKKGSHSGCVGWGGGGEVETKPFLTTAKAAKLSGLHIFLFQSVILHYSTLYCIVLQIIFLSATNTYPQKL
jgi:hypothetical protein